MRVPVGYCHQMLDGKTTLQKVGEASAGDRSFSSRNGSGRLWRIWSWGGFHRYKSLPNLQVSNISASILARLQPFGTEVSQDQCPTLSRKQSWHIQSPHFQFQVTNQGFSAAQSNVDMISAIPYSSLWLKYTVLIIHQTDIPWDFREVPFANQHVHHVISCPVSGKRQ